MSSPTSKTIKQLFALSGNRCAFESCTQPIYDSASGSIVGEICHICADNPGGPRYDVLQTEDERQGGGNLILFCGVHHKVVDDDEANFPVERLRAMKARHESGQTLDWKEELGDRIVHKLLDGLVSVHQQASTGGTNILAMHGSTTVVHVGVSATEARQIAADLFQANMPVLAGIARETAQQRAREMTDEFLTKLQEMQPHAIQSLADPDMQAALLEAQKGAARSNRSHLPRVLVDLLVDRAASTSEFMNIVLNEAIAAAPKLTVDQFDALSVIFVARYTRNFGVRGVETFRGYFKSHYEPFLAGASRTDARFQHMEYVGCGTIGVARVDINRSFSTTYPYLWCDHLSPAEVQAELDGPFIKKLLQLGALQVERNGEFMVNPAYEEEFEPRIDEGEITRPEVRRWLDFVDGVVKGRFKVSPIEQLVPEFAQFVRYWNATGAGQFSLTSVGIAIAHANLARRGVKGLDLGIWIQ